MTTMQLNLSTVRTGGLPVFAAEAARRADAADRAGRPDRLTTSPDVAVSRAGQESNAHQALYRRLPNIEETNEVTSAQAKAALSTIFARLNADHAAPQTIVAKTNVSLPPSAARATDLSPSVSPFGNLSIEALVSAIQQFVMSERATIQALLIQGLKEVRDARAGLVEEKVEKYREQMQKAIEAREEAYKAEKNNIKWDYFWATVDIAFGLVELVGGLMSGNPLAIAEGILFLSAGITAFKKANIRQAALDEQQRGNTEKAQQLREVADVLEKVELGLSLAGLAVGGVQLGVTAARRVQKAGSVSRAISGAVSETLAAAQRALETSMKAVETAKNASTKVLEAAKGKWKVLEDLLAAEEMLEGIKKAAKAEEAVSKQSIRNRASSISGAWKNRAGAFEISSSAEADIRNFYDDILNKHRKRPTEATEELKRAKRAFGKKNGKAIAWASRGSKAVIEAQKAAALAAEAEKESTIVRSIMRALHNQGQSMIAETQVIDAVREAIATVGRTERLGEEVARRLVSGRSAIIKRTLTPSRSQVTGAAGYMAGRAYQAASNISTARWLADQAFQIKKLEAEIASMQSLQDIQQRCIDAFLQRLKDNGAKLLASQTNLLVTRQLLTQASHATANALAPTLPLEKRRLKCH